MLPGMPLVFAGSVPDPVAPYSLSGSWETNLDGWTLVHGTRSGGSPSNPSESYIVSSGGQLEATFPVGEGGGLKITAGCLGYTNGGGTSIRIAYRLGGTGWVTLVSHTDLGGIITPMSGWFIAPRGQSVDIMIEGVGVNTGADDWSIVGTNP